ncbi:MAG: PucR family transcriptional regulator [Ruminococcus sp.]|jgi:sugar diacid utilization regulator
MMNLSLSFICSQLPYCAEVINEMEGKKYSGIGIFSDSLLPRPDTLYLWVSGEMRQDCDGLVLVGERLPEKNMPILWIRETIDPAEVFNDIFDIFHKFHLWSDKIMEGMSKRRPLKEIMEMLNQVTPNPWYLTDNGFRTCVIKEDPVAMDISALWRYQYYHGHMAFQAIYKLISSGDMSLMNSTERAIIFHKTEAFSMPFVSRTVFSSKGIAGHLFIIGMHNELSCYEVEIADYFGDAISSLMDYVDESSVTARGFYDFFFIDLIEENEVKDTEKKILMDGLGWRLEDEYIVCVMVIPSFWQVQNKLNTVTIYEIEEMMPCKAFLYEDKVVFLLNKTCLTQKMRNTGSVMEYIKGKTQIITKKYGSSIGCSDSFYSLEKLSVYYRQAVLAAEYASLPNPEDGVSSYNSVCVPYLLKEVQKTVPRDFVLHPAVKELEAYDKANHTEFLKTLYVYLKNERRTMETVKELYIHRNSLLYRLERIEKLTGVRLEDYYERLRLLLSCEIYFEGNLALK